jgi:hypothetical protein
MTNEVAVRRRRTPAEIEQIAGEFKDSGLNRSQFCRRQGLSLGTLNRYLMRVRGETSNEVAEGGLLAVELRDRQGDRDRKTECGLAVVLSNGRRVEVGAAFDGLTLQRLLRVLETV